MSMHRVKHFSKKVGQIKVYEYEPRSYHLPAVEKARRALLRQPFQRVFGKDGASRWRVGKRGHRFNDATIRQLIERGIAVCVGDFIEMKGKVR